MLTLRHTHEYSGSTHSGSDDYYYYDTEDEGCDCCSAHYVECTHSGECDCEDMEIDADGNLHVHPRHEHEHVHDHGDHHHHEHDVHRHHHHPHHHPHAHTHAHHHGEVDSDADEYTYEDDCAPGEARLPPDEEEMYLARMNGNASRGADQNGGGSENAGNAGNGSGRPNGAAAGANGNVPRTGRPRLSDDPERMVSSGRKRPGRHGQDC